jgi:hypothetical protein
VLDAPPKPNLGVRLLHRLRYRGYDGVVHESSVRERAVRLNDDALRFAKRARLALLKEWVHFDVVDRRRQAGVREQFFEVRNEEVAHADRARTLLRVQLLERSPGIQAFARDGVLISVGLRRIDVSVAEAQSRCDRVVRALAAPRLPDAETDLRNRGAVPQRQ